LNLNKTYLSEFLGRIQYLVAPCRLINRSIDFKTNQHDNRQQ